MLYITSAHCWVESFFPPLAIHLPASARYTTLRDYIVDLESTGYMDLELLSYRMYYACRYASFAP